MTTARLTFRAKAGSVCWQKQLRDHFLVEGTPPVPHLDVKRAIVRPVSRRLAEQVILKYEWLGTMSVTSLHYGIFFGPFCAGVTCVAGTAGTAGADVHKQFGIDQNQLAILARGACVHWAPLGANSRLVAWTCKLLSREKTAKLIIAYSDVEAGEIGTIYQACGWSYIGKTCQRIELIAPTGRVKNDRALGHYQKRLGCTRTEVMQRLKSLGWRQQPNNPKHKYVCILDRSDAALVARIEAMRQPYPKRAASFDGEAAADHAAEGGSSPTAAL